MNCRIEIAAMCSLLLVAATGCQRTTPPAPPPSAGGSMASHSWSPTAHDTESVPGIDQAHLWCWWIAREPALLIWADVEDGAGHSIATPDGGFTGRLNGMPIQFHHQTVSIAHTDYELASGSLFLISTRGEMPVVKQLNCHMAELDILKPDGTGLDNTKLKALAKRDVDISAFFGDLPADSKAPQ